MIQIGSTESSERETVVFEVLHLKYAQAHMLADSLELLLRDASQGRNSRVQVLPDNRLNALLIRAPEESLADLKELVSHLDVEVEQG